MTLKVAFHYLFVFLLTSIIYLIISFTNSEMMFNVIQILLYVGIFLGLYHFEIGIRKNTIKNEMKEQLSDKYFLFSFLFSGILFLFLIVGFKSPIAYVNGSFNIGSILMYIYRNLIFAAFVEEFIFRNCYLKELSKKHSFFVSSIIVGFLWIFLHLPSYIFQNFMINDIIIDLFIGTIKGIVLAYTMKLLNNVFINTLFHFNMGYTSNIGFVFLLPIIFLKLNKKVFDNKPITQRNI